MLAPEELEQAQSAMLARKEQKRADAKRASARECMRKKRRYYERKNVRHVQVYRKRKKAEARAARHLEIVAEKAARAQRRAVREEKKACDLRKHATERQGFVDGYNAAAPKTDAELKAQSWANRYREGYAKGRAEKLRVDALLLAERWRYTPAPVTIQLT